MIDTKERVKQLLAVQDECRELFERKNGDYGDAFAAAGPVGVLVRIGDKLKRLQKVTRDGVHLVSDEKVRDTLVDLANYAMMAVMLLDEHEAPPSFDANGKQLTLEDIKRRLPEYETLFERRAAESDAPKSNRGESR